MAPLPFVTDDSFGDEVMMSPVLTVVTFWATWCGPCRLVAATLEEIAAEHPELRVVRVDVDVSPDVTRECGVESVPTTLVFQEGVVVASIHASQPKDVLLALILGTRPPGSGTPLIERGECTMPVSPTVQIRPDTLFEPADPADGRLLYLPVFALVEDETGGLRTLRVRLRPAGGAWRLELACTGAPRAGGNAPMDVLVTPLLQYTTAAGLPRMRALSVASQDGEVFSSFLDLPTIVERDEVFHAMTVFDWRCRLVLSCRFDAAVPFPPAPQAETLYHEGAQEVDIPLDFADGLFVFDPALHPGIFSGIDDVIADASELMPRGVTWQGRLHQYYQEPQRPHRFRFLPDRFALARTVRPPLVPDLRVRLDASDGALDSMRGSIEYGVRPVVDPDRLLHAAQQLRVHLPAELPAGVDGPVLEPLVVTDPAKLSLELVLPAGGAGSGPVTRAGVVKNLADPFSDQISDLTIADVRQIFDALLGASAVVFSGTVHIGEQGGRPPTSVPFVGRLASIDGPVLTIAESQSRDGTLRVALTNASESPVIVNAIGAELTAGDRAVAARLEDLRVADVTAGFPVALAPAAALTARVVAVGPTIDGPAVGRYEVRDIELRLDPDAVWDAIFDATAPAQHTRVIKVLAIAEWFKPHTDISAIAIDFDNGDEVVLSPQQLEASAKVRVPIKDLVVHAQREGEYRYTQITIRGSGSSREEKVDRLDILIPDVALVDPR